jgi:hypothetical protein
MKTSKVNKYVPLIVGAFVAVIALGIVYFAIYKNNQPRPVKVAVVAGTSLDDRGNPVNPTSAFSVNDKNIYVVVNLKNAKKNDVVSYARFYKGKYINAQSTRVVDNKTNHVIFAFNKDKGYPKGKYDYKFFVNKKFISAYTYTVN